MAKELALIKGGPYPIHPAAHLGNNGGEDLDEAVVEDLMDKMRTSGFLSEFAIELYWNKVLEGRHRQEAALRLKALGIEFNGEVIEPIYRKISLVNTTPEEYVFTKHHLRPISQKAMIFYAVRSFPTEGTKKLARRLGLDPNKPHMTLSEIRSIFTKVKPKVFAEYEAGRITRAAVLKKAGLDDRKSGVSYVKEQLDDAQARLTEKEEAVTELSSDVEILSADLDFYKTKATELEKRVKALDPQERISRAAEGDSTEEDRLRDRLEASLDESKRLVKINEKLALRVKTVDRLEFATRDVLSEYNWNERTITPPVLTKAGHQTRPHQFVALLSDAHYGEVVRPEEALGIKYNCDIAQRRIEHYRDMLIRFKDLREPSYGIEKLTIASLGDMLSGNIHEELENTNERNITKQMAEMSKILYDVTVDLAQYFPEVEVIVIPGNHPRVHKKPQNKEKYDNFEHSMGLTIKNSIEINPNVTNVSVVVPEDLLYVHEVYGYRIGMMHGDGAKVSSYGGIPFYGLAKKQKNLQDLFLERGMGRLDMITMGHFHQHIYMSGTCDMLVNGAVKGADEYSINQFHSATAPKQVLLEFHPEHGLAAQEHINLEHIT